ncbi:MAG TPA: HPF/RaiA family ribosome-associated protein [Gemmatimonadales bacterium]|nr:HPF/RaiA family ribosome-associated protein [Gemmatimonadales bacterium]
MEIIIQAHNASVSEQLRERATRAVGRAAGRVRGAVDAVVRFEADGPDRRVLLQLHAARQRSLVSQATASRYEDALSDAITRLESQLRQAKRAHRGTRASGEGPLTA